MKQLKFAVTILLLLSAVTISISQVNSQANTSVLGTFVATTPCSYHTRPLPGIPVNSDCEAIKWNLTLYQDESKKAPTTYKLYCVFGLPKQGTLDFEEENKIYITGKWTISKGAGSNPNAIVYRLHDEKTNKTISLLKLNDSLLHLLDSEQRLMIGSAAWSYTLNRLVR